MTNFDELSTEDLTFSSLEGNRLQQFLQNASNTIEHLVLGENLTIGVYSDDPWRTLNGFHGVGWKYVPATPQPSYDGCYGHLIWEGPGFPQSIILADALHRHFRANA